VDVIAGSNKDEHTSLGGNVAFRDTMMWAMRLFAEKQTAIGKRAYWYLFTHEPPVEPGGKDLKATHATEIVYVFNNLGAPRVIPDISSPKLAMESERDGRRDVVLLGQLREERRPERQGPAQLAALQGPQRAAAHPRRDQGIPRARCPQPVRRQVRRGLESDPVANLFPIPSVEGW
jgi:hypothetical protein